MSHAHTIARAAERWGVVLTREDVRLLADKIICGLAVEFERESRKVRKVFVTTNSGVELPVVYNVRRGVIITILPPDAAEVQRAYAKRNIVSEGQS